MTDWLKGKTYLDPDMTQDNGGEWVHVEDVFVLLAEGAIMREALTHYADGTNWREEPGDAVCGVFDCFDWPGDLGEDPYSIARTALDAVSTRRSDDA